MAISFGTDWGTLTFRTYTNDYMLDHGIDRRRFAAWYIRLKKGDLDRVILMDDVREFLSFLRDGGEEKLDTLLLSSSDSAEPKEYHGRKGLLRHWIERQFQMAPAEFQQRMVDHLFDEGLQAVKAHRDRLFTRLLEVVANEALLIHDLAERRGAVMQTAENEGRFVHQIDCSSLYVTVPTAFKQRVGTHLRKKGFYEVYQVARRGGQIFLQEAIRWALHLGSADDLEF